MNRKCCPEKDIFSLVIKQKHFAGLGEIVNCGGRVDLLNKRRYFVFGTFIIALTQRPLSPPPADRFQDAGDIMTRASIGLVVILKYIRL